MAGQASLDTNNEQGPAATQARVRARPLAIFAFTCSAIGLGLGLLLGQEPVAIVTAPLGVIIGLVALVRSKDQGRRGLAIAAIAIGSVVTALSLAMMLSMRPV